MSVPAARDDARARAAGQLERRCPAAAVARAQLHEQRAAAPSNALEQQLDAPAASAYGR